jgi:hypothetical protein
VLVAHACKGAGLWFKAHLGKELKECHLKKKKKAQKTPSHKKAGEVDQGVVPEFKPQ